MSKDRYLIVASSLDCTIKVTITPHSLFENHLKSALSSRHLGLPFQSKYTCYSRVQKKIMQVEAVTVMDDSECHLVNDKGVWR